MVVGKRAAKAGTVAAGERRAAKAVAAAKKEAVAARVRVAVAAAD